MKDIASTIVGEIVVSRRFRDLYQDQEISGVDFRPVRFRPASSAVSEDWFQLCVNNCTLDIAPTTVGVNPFDEDLKGAHRCPNGDLLGLNLLSEISAKRASYGGADILCSTQFIGVRRGLLRPERVMCVSSRLWKLMDEAGIKGFKIEVAHLVD